MIQGVHSLIRPTPEDCLPSFVMLVPNNYGQVIFQANENLFLRFMTAQRTLDNTQRGTSTCSL